MSSLSITKLYDLLTVKVGKESAGDIISYIEEKVLQESSEKSNIFATKEDLANTKTEIIKMLFFFWLGQAATTIGFISYFLKK